MKTLPHAALVVHQASPETLIAIATGRPVWTKAQVDDYKEHYKNTHQISFAVRVLAGFAGAVLNGARLVTDAFQFIKGHRDDVDPDAGFMPSLYVRLKDVSNGRWWMASDIVDDVYWRGDNKHVLPPEVSQKLAAILQIYPTAEAIIHTFATDPILEIELVDSDGVITSFFPLVWDIDSSGAIVFIDPPAA